jgi:phosphate transport system substrate-binding protein
MPPRKITARRAAFAAFLSLASALALSCGGGNNNAANNPGAVRLQGAGATFPNPLYQKWLSEYKKVNPSASVDYQSVGSGAGVKQFTERTVDFGATDLAMTDDELKKAQGEVVHVPTVLGAVVVTYDLAGVAEPLRFSSDVLADIFLGKIKRWDDARLKADNPGAALPSADISVAYRAEGSGTSAVFTDYLSKVSAEWKERVGASKTPKFPAGQGGRGNDGVTAIIKQQPNTIGYVELIYARQNKLPVALIKNSAGNFVEPSLEAVTAAASESVAATPDDLRVSITDAAGATAYPISSYTYVLVYKDQADTAKGRVLVDFLWWGLHEGTQFARALDFAPLPDQIRTRAEAKLNSITSGGKTLRQG